MKKLLLILLLCTSLQASDEIRAYYETGSTLYAIIRNSSGQAWDTSNNAFEAWNTMSDYDISLTDKDGGMYLGDIDTDLTAAGSYSIIILEQAGGSVDDDDYPILFEEGYWTGSAWKSNQKQLVDVVADTNEIQDDWKNGGRLDTILDAIQTMTDMMIIVTTDVNDANDANDFTITSGQAEDDAYTGHNIIVQDADDLHWEVRRIYEYRDSLEIYVDEPFSFTPASGDVVKITGVSYGGLIDNIYSHVKTTMIPVFYQDDR